MKDRVLVTGGAGFIGSHLTEALVRKGLHVTVLDNFSAGVRKNLETVEKDIELCEGDIRNRPLVFRLMKGIRTCFHQAAMRSVPRSLDAPLEYQEVNVGGTVNVLEAAKWAGLEKVIFASSSSVYGLNSALPQEETHRLQPVSPYAVSKLQGEEWGRVYTRCYQLRTVALRYFNVFGPRQPVDGQYSAVFPGFIGNLLKGTQPTIYGDGKQSRDFTFVKNVVDCNILAMDKDEGEDRVFNVACGRQTSVLDVLNAISRALGVKADPHWEKTRPGDVRHTFASIERAKHILGYMPQVDFQKGVEHTVQWFQENAEKVLKK